MGPPGPSVHTVLARGAGFAFFRPTMRGVLRWIWLGASSAGANDLNPRCGCTAYVGGDVRCGGAGTDFGVSLCGNAGEDVRCGGAGTEFSVCLCRGARGGDVRCGCAGTFVVVRGCANDLNPRCRCAARWGDLCEYAGTDFDVSLCGGAGGDVRCGGAGTDFSGAWRKCERGRRTRLA